MTNRFVWCSAAACLAGGELALGQFIGADFGAGTAPPNWNAIAGAGLSADLRDDTGAVTSVDLTITGTVGPFARVVNAGTIPQHGYALTGLDNYWFGTGTVTATFSDLIPGAAYNVWVFGLRAFVMNNRVTISGGSAPIQFDQIDTVAGNLWPNGRVGNSGLTLHSFAEVQTATPGGEVSAAWLQTPGSTSTGWAIAGIAIELAEAPCYADCDTSTGKGVLDVFDFLCFQNRYDAGAAYACDCDTSTGPGVCDVFDFLCFQNAFDAGCP